VGDVVSIIPHTNITVRIRRIILVKIFQGFVEEDRKTICVQFNCVQYLQSGGRGGAVG
jgi:hypothetical protein